MSTATAPTAPNELYIGGSWRPPADGGSLQLVSPADGRVIGTFPEPSRADGAAAVAAARQAFDVGPWSAMTITERAQYVQRFANAYSTRSEEFSQAWTTESGPTISHSRLVQGLVAMCFSDIIERSKTCAMRQRREVPDGIVDVIQEPIGVALVVMPWNGPGLYVAWKVVPALLAGCTVVVKTAVESQLTSRLIAECAHEAGFPDGVISVLAAPTEVSEALVANPAVDKVSLTGSVPAGRAVMAACAPRITKLTLELGGKSAAVIAGDVDIDPVLDSFIPGFIAGTGQVCVALTRLIVPRSRGDEIVAAVVSRLSALKIGDPADPNSDVGPLATRRQLTTVEEYVASGVEQGARIVLGGRRPNGFDGGFYYEPTVFVDVAPEMRIAQEEIFGPVLSVIAYDDLDEAIAIANGTKYGLAASVYAADADLADRVAERLQAGTVAINTAGPSFFAPFGGTKQSGIGREFGLAGIEEFLQTKAIKRAGT
jgi:aldehyde dehydrogenase (NAD+)